MPPAIAYFEFHAPMKRALLTLPTVIFGISGILIGILVAIDSVNSDPSLMDLCFLLFAAYGAGVFVMLVIGRGKALLLRSLFAALLSVITVYIVAWIQCPTNIRYEYSYPGNTGTYQKVQFYHKESGQWIEGPSVEGWPLTVSFPDINHDGYSDIRVIESLSPEKGVIEFIYIPKPKDKIYWKAGRMDSELSAAYPPGKIFYP